MAPIRDTLSRDPCILERFGIDSSTIKRGRIPGPEKGRNGAIWGYWDHKSTMDQKQEEEKRRLLEEIDGEYRRMEEITMRRDVHPIEIEAHEKYIADLKHRLWRIEPTPARQREEDKRLCREALDKLKRYHEEMSEMIKRPQSEWNMEVFRNVDRSMKEVNKHYDAWQKSKKDNHN